MSVGFAGARGLDERRRRRLAQNADAGERRAPPRPAIVAAPSGPQFAASPIESLVRPQVWVNVLLATLGLTVCGGALYLGERIGQDAPTASASFGPRGLLLRGLCAGLFVLGAQLAAAIHWYRARSRKDFNGRYRVWHFVVPSLLVFGFGAATDGHLVLAEWAQNHWQIVGPYARTLLWMVPTGTVLLAMVRLLHTEMRGTRGAAPSLWTATIAAVINAAVVLEAPVPLDAAVIALAGRCAMLLWPLGLLLALLFYARRVIYVTNEPSALPVAATTEANDAPRNWFSWWRPRKSSCRSSSAAGEKRANATDAERTRKTKPAADDQDDRDDPRTSGIDDAPQATSVAKPATAKLQAPSAGESSADRSQAAAAAAIPSVQRSDTPHDFDELDDDNGQRGLSKKERKRLRQQQQRERSGALD